MSIILRSIKGSPLTYNELDGNFVYLSQSYAFLNGPNTFTGAQTIVGDLTVFGSASFSFVTSSVTEISASTFGIAISSPSIRYGFYNVYDTGSTSTTSSLAWDSLNNYWTYQKVTGSVSSSAVLLTGPISTGGLGTEVTIPQYRIPMSNGNQSLVSSNIYSSGSSNIVTGSINILPFVESPLPTLGVGSGGFFLGGDNGTYGLYAGVLSLGDTWIQSNRNDSLAAAYNISLQPVGGNVNIGKINSSGIGPKLDISGSTVITGSLSVSQGITGNLTGTASYASFAPSSLSSSFSFVALSASNALSSSFSQTASLAFNSITSSYAVNAVSSSFATTSISSSLASTSSLALQAISASFATTASYILNAVSSSFASTSSFLRPLSQSVLITGSVNLTGSLIIRNAAATTMIGAFGRSGSFYIDLNGVGNNYIDGNVLYVRNSAGTSNITVTTPSKFTVHVPTELSGSLSIQRADGNKLLFTTSSVTSSISSSIVPTTASFDGTITFTPSGAPEVTWNTDLDIYYSGNSGSGHTELSPVSNQIADTAQYDTFTISIDNGITLTPSGSIPNDKYTVWIYASGSINKWFQKTDNDIAELGAPGLVISLSGIDTDTNLENDLISNGFAEAPDPNPYTNNINTVVTTTLSSTSSLVDVKSDIIITGSLRVTGSSNLTGTQTITGSLVTLGSSNIIGDQIITGSLVVSGSTVMTNAGTVILSGSTSISGSTTLRGTTTITGSLIIASSSGDFYIYGNKQGNYGAFQDLVTQTGSANVSHSFQFRTIDEFNGVRVTGSLSSSLYFENGGTYDIQFSAQLYTPTGANVAIWLKKNGTNMPGTAGRILTSNNDYRLPAWNYVLSLVAGDTIDIVWQSDQANTEFSYIAGSGNIPSAASVIITAIQVR